MFRNQEMRKDSYVCLTFLKIVNSHSFSPQNEVQTHFPLKTTKFWEPAFFCIFEIFLRISAKAFLSCKEPQKGFDSPELKLKYHHSHKVSISNITSLVLSLALNLETRSCVVTCFFSIRTALISSSVTGPVAAEAEAEAEAEALTGVGSAFTGFVGALDLETELFFSSLTEDFVSCLQRLISSNFSMFPF